MTALPFISRNPASQLTSNLAEHRLAGMSGGELAKVPGTAQACSRSTQNPHYTETALRI